MSLSWHWALDRKGSDRLQLKQHNKKLESWSAWEDHNNLEHSNFIKVSDPNVRRSIYTTFGCGHHPKVHFEASAKIENAEDPTMNLSVHSKEVTVHWLNLHINTCWRFQGKLDENCKRHAINRHPFSKSRLPWVHTDFEKCRNSWKIHSCPSELTGPTLSLVRSSHWDLIEIP